MTSSHHVSGIYWHVWRALQWRDNEQDGVLNHQPHNCLLNRLIRRQSKKTSKLRVTGLCVVTGEFQSQRASNAENVSIWWHHHGWEGSSKLTKTHWDFLYPFPGSLQSYLQMNQQSKQVQYPNVHMIGPKLRSLWATWSTFHQFWLLLRAGEFAAMIRCDDFPRGWQK